MRLLLSVCLVAACALAQADRSDVVPLRHKIPEDLLQPLRQTFPEAGIQAFNGQLIVRAPDDATFRRIVDLVNQLDTAVRTLRITVEQRLSRESSETRLDAQGQVLIAPRDSHGQVVISGAGRDAESSSASRQMLSALDGSAAYIQLGSQRFIPTLSFIHRPGYRIVSVGGQWQAAGTGFYVAPRLIGDQVLLRLSPQSSAFLPRGAREVQQVYSEVQGPLGEWLPVGESVQETSRESRGLSSYSSNQGTQRYTVWVRVDISR